MTGNKAERKRIIGRPELSRIVPIRNLPQPKVRPKQAPFGRASSRENEASGRQQRIRIGQASSSNVSGSPKEGVHQGVNGARTLAGESALRHGEIANEPARL